MWLKRGQPSPVPEADWEADWLIKFQHCNAIPLPVTVLKEADNTILSNSTWVEVCLCASEKLYLTHLRGPKS